MVAERIALDAASSPGLGLLFPVFGLVALVGDAAGLDDRAASLDTMIAVLEDFVSVDFARMEAKAVAGDDAQATRLLRATRNILAAARGTSAVDDAIDDAIELTKATVNETRDAFDKLVANVCVYGGGIVGAVVGGGLAANVAQVLPVPLWVRLAAAAAAAGGVGYGGVTVGRQLATAFLRR